MTVGVIMLCHTALGRAAEVARHWAADGSPVVIHLDTRVRAPAVARLKAALADVPDIRFAPRHRCEWGTWGLVAATQAAAEMLLREYPGLSHVYLASGACLPLRPASELTRYLQERPGTDFIESVTTEDVGWTIGGLNIERFTLRFPFSWRRHRWLFDRHVRLQRRLGLRRRIPAGLQPHLGSQWWCLTCATLQAILTDPRRAEFDRYFARVWIPDESYFQTLVRRHGVRVESRSLTLSKFDFQGKPHIFYDDHLQLLRRSDCFVARKIWPHADRLYRVFLSGEREAQTMAEPNPGNIDRLFSKAVERRTKGRPGLYMQSRFPRENWENGKTAAPYSVFEGFAELFEGFEGWLGKHSGARVHGHLFGLDRAVFAGGEAVIAGAQSDCTNLRDYNPRSFLTSLIWNARGTRQCFQFGPADRQEISWFMAMDPNAQISVITGAWALPLFRAGGDPAVVRRMAAQLQKTEGWHLDVLRSPHVKARVRVWTLAEFIENPMEPLQQIMEEGGTRLRLAEAPRMVDLTGFGQFLQDLRNQGMQPLLMGDIPVIASSAPHSVRPYLVG